MATTKKTANRYSGVDSVNWIVRYSDGTKQEGSYGSFKEANLEAGRANMTDGPFAQAVRS